MPRLLGLSADAISRTPATTLELREPMKTPLHVSHARSAGLTIVEVIVITLVAFVIIGFVLPMFTQRGSRSPFLDSVFDAKRINIALRMYANDHDGIFPDALTDGNKLAVGDSSNRVFEQLMPKYTTSKNPFINKRSAWCKNLPTNEGAGDAYNLKSGQNDWIYVAGLKDDSNPEWPLIATATASATNLTYTKSTTAKGGLWGGTDAIVAFADGSARQLSGPEMDTTDMKRTFPKRKDTGGNIFVAAPDWLGPGSVILAPE